MSIDIEVVTSKGIRFRYSNCNWMYGSADGPAIDSLDMSVVQIFKEENDETVIVDTITDVVKVGDVLPAEQLLMPERELLVCPRCGYKQSEKLE